MKNIIPPFLFLLLLIFSCSDGNTKTSQKNYTTKTESEASSTTEIDSIYMYTGIYNVVGEGKGIRMRQEKSDEIYTLSAVPFVSVNDVIKAELERTTLKEGIYNQLCLTFNDTGKQNLREGTGRQKYFKIACVIANRLLYVVENKNTIGGGNMCIGLVDYSEKEMQTMLYEVSHKK